MKPAEKIAEAVATELGGLPGPTFTAYDAALRAVQIVRDEVTTEVDVAYDPSDAQVDAAMDAFYGKNDAALAHSFRKHMRAALCAASANAVAYDPSDEQIRAAREALGHLGSSVTTPMMRRALRAATGWLAAHEAEETDNVAREAKILAWLSESSLGDQFGHNDFNDGYQAAKDRMAQLLGGGA